MEQHLYDPNRWPPRPGTPGREDYEWRVAASRAAGREPEEERFFGLLLAASRPTGNDQHDLNELNRVLILIEDRMAREGESKYLLAARAVCEEVASRITLRRLTGHPPPFSKQERGQKYPKEAFPDDGYVKWGTRWTLRDCRRPESLL